jgi:hypothetical protein
MRSDSFLVAASDSFGGGRVLHVTPSAEIAELTAAAAAANSGLLLPQGKRRRLSDSDNAMDTAHADVQAMDVDLAESKLAQVPHYMSVCISAGLAGRLDGHRSCRFHVIFTRSISLCV